MIQQTSLDAFQELKDKGLLGKRQSQILEVLEMIGPATNMEIAESTGWSINRVTPRIYELRKEGFVVPVERRPCNITGNEAHTWGVKTSC